MIWEKDCHADFFYKTEDFNLRVEHKKPKTQYGSIVSLINSAFIHRISVRIFIHLCRGRWLSFFANRNLILGNLRRGITKYVEDVSIKDLDIGYVDNDRTHMLLRVEYTSVEENKTTINDVTFV